MKIGIMTNALVSKGINTLSKLAKWSIENNISCLEIGPNIPLNRKEYDEVYGKSGIEISALTFCRNFLSQDQEERENLRKELLDRINLASILRVNKIVTSTGINKSLEEGIYDKADSIRRTPERSLDEVTEFFLPIVELCEKKNVKLAFENCPLMGNIAISPYMWALLFEKISSDKVGLAYDPSHLVWQGIDPYKPIIEFKDKIIHFHAKDTIVNHELLERVGILTNFDWWRYCIPGKGMLNWEKILTTLKEINYSGSISIEHEDKEYEKTLADVSNGIIKANEYLKQFI